jgi:hypothetical protein
MKTKGVNGIGYHAKKNKIPLNMLSKNLYFVVYKKIIE